jgi:hypothetical protein
LRGASRLITCGAHVNEFACLLTAAIDTNNIAAVFLILATDAGNRMMADFLDHHQTDESSAVSPASAAVANLIRRGGQGDPTAVDDAASIVKLVIMHDGRVTPSEEVSLARAVLAATEM